MQLGNRQQLDAERRVFEDNADRFAFSLTISPHSARRICRAVNRSAWDDPTVVTELHRWGRSFRVGVIRA